MTENKQDSDFFCPICESYKVLEISKNSFFKTKVYKCQNCLLHFNELNHKKIDSYYHSEYWEFKKKGSFTTRFRRHLFKKLRAASQFNYIKKKNCTVLDIGGGDGTTAIFFERKGCTVSIIEPDIIYSEKIRKNHPSVKILPEEYFNETTAGENFDLIILSHVLEHMPKINEILSSLKMFLSKGLLFIEVPNCDNPEILKTSIMKNPHLFHFSESSLKHLLQRNGYKILRFDSMDYKQPKKLISDDIRFLFLSFLSQEVYFETTKEKGRVYRILVKKD